MIHRMRALPPLTLLLASVVTGAQYCSGQTPDFVLNGTVKEQDGHTAIGNALITAIDTTGRQETRFHMSTRADRRGKYRLSLPYDQVYLVEYAGEGRVSKYVILDLTGGRDRDRVGGQQMSLEISLFKELRGVDYTALREPVAICRFDRKRHTFMQDPAYSKARQEALDSLKELQLAAGRPASDR